MICPYSGCKEDLPQIKSPAHCPRCKQPVFLCPYCESINHAFARYCRMCGSNGIHISFPSKRARELWPDGSNLAGKSPHLLDSIKDSFWISPLPYGGFLWFLSLNGVVWQLSPARTRPFNFALLGEGFGQSPFIIRELSVGNAASDRLPFLLATDGQSIKGLNLLTAEAVEFLHLPEGESIPCSIAREFATIEADGNTIYYLKRSQERTLLCTYHIASRTAKEYPLNDLQVCGLFRVGDQIGAYSPKSLIILNNGRPRAIGFRDEFRAWVKSDDIRMLQPHPGRMPFLQNADSLYLPGVRGDQVGLLFVSLRDSMPRTIFIPVMHPAAYTQDAQGHLLMASRGKTEVYEMNAAMAVAVDEQLSSDHVAYYDEPLTTGFTKSSAGVETLRFYYDRMNIGDYPLKLFLGFQESLGFFPVGGALVFVYLDENNYVGAAVWED